MKHKPVPVNFRVLKECWNQDTRQRLKEGDIISGLSSFEVSRNLAEGNIVAHYDPIIPRVGQVVETQMVAPVEIRIEPEQKTKGIFARRGRPRK